MHLPLLLVQDSVLKTKTPLPNLHWIGQDGRQVCSLSPQLVREVDLSSGSCSKVAKLTPHTRTAVAISVTRDGVFVYGILSSGELFFWHTATNQLRQAKGIPEVVTPTTNPPESNVVREFFKPLLPQSFGSNVASDGAEKAACSAAAHLRPKVFASSSCAKVVVVLEASQVYVWERSVGCPMEDCSVSQHVPGSWSVAECPADVPLPNTHSKETQISCCFMYEESSEECHISFTFVESCCVVVSTLVLRWQGLRGHLPAAHWHPLVVSFSALGVRENELPHLKGALISSYARGRSLLAVAVNSQKQHSRLLYIHPLCTTAAATNVQDAATRLRHSHKYSWRSQWVSDLTWTHDNLYLVGCLRSGALFIATRMGSLIKISCQGEGIQLQPANILGLQPHSTVPSAEVAEEEGNTNPRGPPSLTFCVSSHPRKHQVLLSSGFRASVLSLPLDGRKEGEVVDCLLSSATHALHLLCNSAVTHDYAYIRDSTWRLAHSVLDLTQGLTTTSSPNSPKISLWDRRVVAAADKAGTPERTPADNGDPMIEQVMKPLMAAWVLIGSRGGPHTMEWRRRAGAVVVVVVRLAATLLRVTTHDDHCEHQLQLLLVLHFYHQYVRVLCVWPNCFHMLKPTLQLTHRLLHTVLACERHAGERSMVSTLLILTQTLSSVECSLTRAFALRPLNPKTLSKAETVQVLAGIEVTNVVMSTADGRNNEFETDNTISLRMKKVWQCLHENAKKVYTQLAEKEFNLESYQKSVLVLNILQNKLQNIGCDLSEKNMKLSKCHQLYLDGLYLKAIHAWKCEIMTCLTKGHGQKVVAQDLHSILYACFVHEGLVGISNFINWLDSLLRSLFCPKKQSSLPKSVNKSATKAKNNENRLLFEYFKIDQSPKIDVRHKATTKEVEETKVSLVKKHSRRKVSSENGVHTLSPVERASSPDHGVEPSAVPWIISAARQVMGNVGRILALESVGCHRDVPAPHRPHNIPPLWTSSLQPQGKVHLLSTLREEAAFPGHGCVDAAAQALALAGCWGDLAVFTSWLGDAKMTLVAGLLASICDNEVSVPNTVLPLHQIKDLLCQPITSTSAEFHSHHELLQLAAMADLEVVPVILEECLAKVKELTPLFATFVPPCIHLPAPPVFGPLGPQDGEVLPLDLTTEDSHSERRLRQEVAGWLRLACQVTSAAGIAYPLLLSLQQEYSKLPVMGGEELSCLVESLGCLQENWHPQGPEWERIFWLWHNVVTEVWVLYSRDKLSLGIRSLVRNASALRQNQELQETCILEILSWVAELNELCGHDSWRSDLVACALTAASEGPPVSAVAAALARVVPQPSEIPSLLRDKAERLFANWKSTNIADGEVKPCLKGEKNEREVISSPEMYASLFSFYEDRFGKMNQRISSEEEKKESSGCMNKYPTKSSYGTSVAARIQEEFRKFLTLFVELTFLRDVQKFPQQTSAVPLLVEFSGVLRRREFEGMKLKNKLHHDETGSESDFPKQNVVNSTCTSSVNTRCTITTPEKKGLFRSLDYSKMLPKGSELLISPEKRQVTSSPSRSTPANKVLHHFEKENLRKSKMSGSSWRKLPTLYLHGRRSRSLSRHKRGSISVRRPRSLSGTGGKGTAQQTASKQHPEQGRKTSRSSGDVIKDLPIQKLLYLPQCLAYTTVQLEAEDTLKLLYWMMSQERRLCLSVVESDSHTSGKGRKVNFTVDDVTISLCWNHLFKIWSHMKDEKSYSEMGSKESMKNKEMEERLERRHESIEEIPHEELVPSHDRDVQVEVNQDANISPMASTKELDMNSLNACSKGSKYVSEAANGDAEKEEQFYRVAHGGSVSHSHLTERNQEGETKYKENIHVDSEPGSPIHLPCDLPDTKLKNNSGIVNDFIDLPNHNKGCIINTIASGTKQDMASGSKESSASTPTQSEDQDSHQQDGSPPKQITKSYYALKKKRKMSKTSPVSSQAVKLEPEDTSTYIRTRENNDSKSEDSSLRSLLKINYKNPSKGHQIIVHAKEAEQSVPSRLPILPTPQRVSNMAGIEAPEESSDAGIAPFGHLLHLPPLTSSASKVSGSADVPDGGNTTPSQPDRVPAEDTLDNITLPDSSHASDLEDQSELYDNSIQNYIMKKNKYEPVDEKAKYYGRGLNAPLCMKERVPDRQWDYGDLNLKPVSLQAKSAPVTFPKDEMSASRSEKSLTCAKENTNTKKTLKLLTLPKLSSSKKCDTKQEKSLLLKQLPVSNRFRNTAKDNQSKDQNAIVTPWLQSKKGKVEDMKPLTIPKYFDSHPMDDGKRKALTLLNPQQVFAFYRQSVLKKHAEKFKSLKVSKKYSVTDGQHDTQALEGKKEQIRSDHSAGNLDQGFLDQVKDYADKYRKGDYRNILRGDEEIRVHYKPIDSKKAIKENVRKDRRLIGQSTPAEDSARPVESKDVMVTEKTHSDISKDNLIRRKELENKHVNTDPYEMRQKVMKTTGIQTSILEEGVIDGSRPPAVPSHPAAQTQTPTVQMVEASVLTDTVVSGMNKSTQVDSLLPHPPSPPPPPPLQGKEASPPPQSAVSPPPPPPCTAPSRRSQASSVPVPTQGCVHIFDIPTEVVKEELKDVEMNKTIHSLNMEKGDQHAIQSLFDSDEKRKTGECFDQVINNDYKEDGVLQKQPAALMLDGNADSNSRKETYNKCKSQNLDIAEELNIIAPVSSVEPNYTDINYDEMTMDKLYDEFCSGRISLEAFYQMSTSIPECEGREEAPLKRDKKQSLAALEQQVLEAAQSINESQHLVEKVKYLIQEPETTHNYKSDERFPSNRSCRQKKGMDMASILKENVGWQEALSVYRNQGKPGALQRFLDAVDFENITSEMIDEIIQCEDSAGLNEARKRIELKRKDDCNLSVKKRLSSTTLFSNKKLPKMRNVDHEEFLQSDVDADSTLAGSDLMTTEDSMKGISSGSEPPDLHLNFTYIRSPDSSHPSTVGSVLGESMSSYDREEKVQQRRREIRAWIKKQRQKRREQAKAETSLTHTKPQLTPNYALTTSRGCTGMPNEAVTNVTAENMGLTGKQLQERKQDRVMKRAKEKEHHQKKREADIAQLLDDHKEDVLLYHSHVKPKPAYESPPILRKSRKLQNFRNTQHRNSPLGTKLHETLHSTSPQSSVSQCKPRLSRYFKTSTEDWRKTQKHSPVGSLLVENFSGEKKKHCVEETSLEKSTSLQMELYYLKRCLDNNKKDKYKAGYWSNDKQAPSLKQSYHHALPNEKNKTEKDSSTHTVENDFSSNVARDSSSWRSLPLSATFTLPLDRISEVASNISETSLSEGLQEVIPFVPAGEDTSTDSSWTVPEEIRNLLYSSQ